MLAAIHKQHIYNTNECPVLPTKEEIQQQVHPDALAAPEQITVLEVTDTVITTGGLRFDIINFMDVATLVGPAPVVDLGGEGVIQKPIIDEPVVKESAPSETSEKASNLDTPAPVVEKHKPAPVAQKQYSETIQEIRITLKRSIDGIIETKDVDELKSKMLATITAFSSLGFSKDDIMEALATYPKLTARIVTDFFFNLK